jgi:phytanoyl-CoA hydroxylase
MDLRYQSAALPTNAKITRLPGEAKRVGAAGVPLACNPPEPDFLVRSRTRPDEVLKTAEEFVALRKNHAYQAGVKDILSHLSHLSPPSHFELLR